MAQRTDNFYKLFGMYEYLQHTVFDELWNNNRLPKRVYFDQRTGLVFILCQFRISPFRKVSLGLSGPCEATVTRQNHRRNCFREI